MTKSSAKGSGHNLSANSDNSRELQKFIDGGLDREPTRSNGPGRPSKSSLANAQRDLNDNQLRTAVWLSMPEKMRVPRTQKDFAAQLGVHESTLIRWRKDPNVVMATRWLALQSAGDPGRISNVIDFFYEVSLDDGLGTRLRVEAGREFLKAVGVYEVAKYDNKLLAIQDVEDFDLDNLSDEELWDVYNQRAISAGVEPKLFPDSDDEVVVAEVVEDH